jgi:hypothetical protein
MKNEMERMWMEVVISWMDLDKPRKNLSEVRLCPGRDSKQSPIEYKSEALPLRQLARSDGGRGVRDNGQDGRERHMRKKREGERKG